MVTHKIKTAIFVIFIAMALLLSACSKKDGTGYLFRYSLLGDPKILDPQLAEDASSLVVLENMFCGLFRTTEGGKLTEGVASDYAISSDGLVYTFTLREDFYWMNADSDFQQQVTASDFVFSFQRLLNRSTQSPYAQDFFCIQNAERYYSGECGVEELGVKATGSFSLEIRLAYTNANFLNLLTTSPAMPCNQAFFESTKGKYGLEVEACVSNGAFFLKSWEYDAYGTNNYLIMRKNKYYNAVYPVAPSSLNFFTQKNTEELEADFISGGTDCIVADGTNKKLFKGGNIIDEFETKSAGLVLNAQSEIFSNPDFRKALSLSIDRSAYNDELSGGARAAYGIVPSGITLLNKSYRELVSESDKSLYTPEQAQTLWSNALTASGKLSVDGMNILVPTGFQNSEWLKSITQQWQSELQFFCGIEPVTNAEYNRRLLAGEYDLVFYQLAYSYNNPAAVLNNFRTGDSGNRIGYSNADVDLLLAQSERAQNLSDCVKLYSAAEKAVIDDCIYLPLFYQKEYLIYPDTVEGLAYNPFTKQIDFSLAKNFD